MKFRKLILTFIVGILSIAFSTASLADETVKVGALYPFSGGLALLGQESYRGLELAINERNAEGGIDGKKIEIVKADAVDPSQAVSAAKRLVSKNVVAIFGSYSSGIAYAATPVAELAGVPYFEMGAVAEKVTTRGYKYLFRSNPTTAVYGSSVINYLHEIVAPGMGLSADDIRIGIIHESGPYGSAVAAGEKKRAEELGYNVVETLSYSSDSVDMSSLVLRLKSSNVNVVLQTAYQNDAILYFQQAKAAGFKPQVFIGAGGGDSMTSTADAAGTAINDAFDVDFPQISINPEGAPGLKKFLKAYKKAYGHPPLSGHSLANYVGANAFLNILASAKSFDADDIRSAVLAYKKPKGESANGWGFDFGKDGQNRAAKFYLMQWQDGDLVTIAPDKQALGKPVFKK